MVATEEMIVIAGLMDKDLVLVPKVGGKVAWVPMSVIVVIAGVCKVIKEGLVVALAVYEVDWKIVVASVAGALAIALLLTDNIPDCVGWAVAVAFVTIAISSRNFVLFGKEVAVAAGSLAEVTGLFSVPFLNAILVGDQVALLLEKKFVIRGKNDVVLGAMELIISVDVVISSISLLVVGFEDEICWAVLLVIWAFASVSRLVGAVLGKIVLPVVTVVVAAVTVNLEDVAVANTEVVGRLLIAVTVEVAITLAIVIGIWFLFDFEVLKEDIVAWEILLLFWSLVVLPEDRGANTEAYLVGSKQSVVVHLNISEYNGIVILVEWPPKIIARFGATVLETLFLVIWNFLVTTG